MITGSTGNGAPGLDENAALRAILEGTAAETGGQFFAALVQNLAKALCTYGAWVTEYLEDERRLCGLAVWMGGEWIEDFGIDIANTPCEAVIHTADLVHYPDRLAELFPYAPSISRYGLVSYLGVPLKDVEDRILGHMAVMDQCPMPREPESLALFQIFAARAAAELRRLVAESRVREREERLSRVVNGAMDAIIELNAELAITLLNPAAEKAFRCSSSWAMGQDFTRLLSEDSRRKLRDLAGRLDCGPRAPQSLWIPGGLQAQQIGGGFFPAEATLSCFESGRKRFYTLVLRNVNDRLEAERRILSLTAQAEYLKEELKALHNFDEILGESPALQRVLDDVRQVAVTEATVLIEGETGTGKELFARAIHAASPRREKPMVTVNCAAIPASLIESEFFGHERGAFTGATAKREGRFALADQGTIFLDEIGEIPVDLQSKLLRVLQEGAFEPVGSSQTVRVNVRVVAATNRSLQEALKEGRFRDDLYYRLNVFPLRLPPLRERSEDIPLLAEAFARRFAQRMGRTIAPLTDEDTKRLQGYSWPGNVRELENVIERAVITAQQGRLNLDRALPEAAEPPPSGPRAAASAPDIRTAGQLLALERDNILKALETCQWRVAGKQGAARLLAMNSSTLSSRMRALGIRRPPA